MSTYQRFEDLPVWQEAVKLYEAVDALLAGVRRRLSYSFRDQLERAALSVSNNIAEKTLLAQLPPDHSLRRQREGRSGTAADSH